MQRFAFLIGAQKAATTSLAYQLNQHPQITLAQSKEPDFFSTAWNKGRDWYARQFPPDWDGICLDASTSYSMLERRPDGELVLSQPEGFIKAPERIKKFAPDAHIFYIVRDPIDRLYSAYLHDVRAGRESRNFFEAVDGNPSYLAPSCYATQIEPYLQLFSREKILILVFEDIVSSMTKAASHCAIQMGLDGAENLFSKTQKLNESYKVNAVGRIVYRVLGRTNMVTKLSKFSRDYLPQSLRGILRRALVETPPPMPGHAREKFAKYFADENRRFEALTGVRVPFKN